MCDLALLLCGMQTLRGATQWMMIDSQWVLGQIQLLMDQRHLVHA